MNEKEIIDIFIKLVGTSIPGYLSYYILTRSNLIDVSKNRSDENKVFLAILSAFNIFIGLLALNSLNPNNRTLITIIIIIVMILVSAFFIPFITPYIADGATDFINFIRVKNSGSEVEQHSRYKQVFDRPGPKRVAVFDFNKNYIASGVLSKSPLNNEFDYFDIILDHEIDQYEKPEEIKFIKLYKKLEQNGDGKYQLYIDFEKKVKIHVFIEPSLRQS